VTDAGGQSAIGFIGKKLGRYLVTSELGRGGMATVYRARDPQLGRDVALKVMHGYFAGRPDLDARFRREAEAVAAIRHPGILAIYDAAPPVAETPGYIVSEIIEGPSLRRLYDERGGRIVPEMAALLVIPMAEALGAAHAAGVVHRDVKPDNVLIDRSGGRARVVLTDFGVAHVAGAEAVTATGAVLGSPAYMSPEQARGGEVSAPSDVFSLGVVLYQLSTGRLPFPGKDPLSVVTAVLRGELLRPSQVNARVGPDLERVIMRCLARDPAARFAGGGAVAEALRAALAEAGIPDE
jgi:serine/threonine protein kinase